MLLLSKYVIDLVIMHSAVCQFDR